MTRRLTTSVLAVFFLLQATWLLHAGMDLLLPTVRQTVATVTDSCCSSACGCPDDVKKANGCCCMPGPAPAHTPSAPSFMEAARCSGTDDALTQPFSQPVVCSFGGVGLAVVESSRLSLPDSPPFLPIAAVSPEKVPIA